MISILKVFATLAGVLLIVMLNQLTIRKINSNEMKLSKKVWYALILIVLNVITMFWLSGTVGRLMFLLPFVLLGPYYWEYRKREK